VALVVGADDFRRLSRTGARFQGIPTRGADSRAGPGASRDRGGGSGCELPHRHLHPGRVVKTAASPRRSGLVRKRRKRGAPPQRTDRRRNREGALRFCRQVAGGPRCARPGSEPLASNLLCSRSYRLTPPWQPPGRMSARGEQSAANVFCRRWFDRRYAILHGLTVVTRNTRTARPGAPLLTPGGSRPDCLKDVSINGPVLKIVEGRRAALPSSAK